MGFEIKLSDNYRAANTKCIGGFIVTRNWQECGEEQAKIAGAFDPRETVYNVREIGKIVEPVEIVIPVEIPETVPEVIEPEVEQVEPEPVIPEKPAVKAPPAKPVRKRKGK
ncbi:MAG: hypothetical protein KKC03_13825 [Bacteroidetes bacterium]|nr:hypothetical protein [Bacteroidota bacterium]